MKTINHGKRQNFTYRVGEKLNGLLTLFLIVVVLSLLAFCSAEENVPTATQNSASHLPIPDL
ncbi:MAG: hypothetical protein LBJ67_05350, partial [Planctomycetaceae bacterium]|nr:hypothetical protein [Planctomycetaceae bacterium]